MPDTVKKNGRNGWAMRILLITCSLLLGALIQFLLGGVSQAQHDALVEKVDKSLPEDVVRDATLTRLCEAIVRNDEAHKAIEHRLVRMESKLDRLNSSKVSMEGDSDEQGFEVH